MGRRLVSRRIIRRNGKALTFTRKTGATFDPIQSSSTGGTTTTAKTKGTISSYTIEEMEGSQIQATDQKLLVPCADFDGKFTPDDRDTITRDADGKVFNIHKVRVLDADKAFLIQVRAG